jgi:hypothetical protein
MLYTPLTPPLVGTQDDLGIGCGSKVVLAELSAKLDVVVDLAVICDDAAALEVMVARPRRTDR